MSENKFGNNLVLTVEIKFPTPFHDKTTTQFRHDYS